jgi:hypothetical protein
MDLYPKYIYDLAWRMSIEDVLHFQDIDCRKDLISLIKIFIDRGVLEDENSYIEFIGDYEGIVRKKRYEIPV